MPVPAPGVAGSPFLRRLLPVRAAVLLGITAVLTGAMLAGVVLSAVLFR